MTLYQICICMYEFFCEKGWTLIKKTHVVKKRFEYFFYKEWSRKKWVGCLSMSHININTLMLSPSGNSLQQCDMLCNIHCSSWFSTVLLPSSPALSFCRRVWPQRWTSGSRSQVPRPRGQTHPSWASPLHPCVWSRALSPEMEERESLDEVWHLKKKENSKTVIYILFSWYTQNHFVSI